MFEFTIKRIPPVVRYFVPALILAGMAAWVIWRWGIDVEYKTETIAQTSTDGGAADQIQLLPGDRFMTTQEGVGVAAWWLESNELRGSGIFNFPSIFNYVAKADETDSGSQREPNAPRVGTLQPAARVPSLFDIDPVVLPDGSRIVVCYKRILAAFPIHWNGSDEVQITRLESAPISMAANQELIALGFETGEIVFRSMKDRKIRNYVKADGSVISKFSTDIERPVMMKFYGDLLAVVSIPNNKITLLEVKNESVDPVVIYSNAAGEHFDIAREHLRLAISPQGRMAVGLDSPNAYVTAANGRSPATPWAAYGTVNALSFLDNYHLVVGGAFRHVYVLAEGKVPFKIADARYGVNAMAINSERLAFVGGDDVVLLSYSLVRTPNVIAIIAIFFMAASAYAALHLYRDRSRMVSPVIAVTHEPSSSDVEAPTLRLPEAPSALVKSFRDGECVLYCGSGMGAQAGFPYWQPFVEKLTEWAIESGFVDPALAASLRAALAQGQYDSVSDNLVSIMRDRQPQLNDYLREIFLREAMLPESVKLLKGLPFSAAMTTNFDNLLEQAFADKSTSSLTPADADLLLQCLHKREFFLLKLYGKLEKPETVMLAPSQYDDVVTGNLVFSSFMETLLISRTVFFVGAGLEGIQAYLKGMPLRRQSRRTHYALVPVTGEAWQAKANPIKERYGIEVLPYSPSEGHPEVLRFLQNVDAKVKEESEDATERVDRGTVLKKISVTDVGPFENLELTFDPHWNILLGDNGVGKSSIIKAIAIAILGEDSRSYAQRIIKAGKPNSVITLESGRATYTTKLFRKNGEARVDSIPGRAFEAEGWLAVAFPPLRTMSWVRPQSVETGTTGRERPTTDDLMPVIVGEADPRLDKLKQWIVNVDYRIKDARARDQDPTQFERLLEDFFNVVGELTTGTKIEFKDVNADTKEITVITDDGELPIEALSQGMTSLIGWVGILLQRMYEVYGKGDSDPKQHYALVLMDEIDAHLHPAWQQTLIRTLGKIFPNVQFIATTHSPLIVGGMKPEQIIRFARDEDDKVVTYTVQEEMTIGRADQVLSSDLFGLQTTMRLNEDLEVLMQEYHELLAKDRSEIEESRFRVLRETLKARIPPTGETPAEQKAMRLVQDLLQSGEDGKYQGVNERILERAEELLTEVSKKRK